MFTFKEFLKDRDIGLYNEVEQPNGAPMDAAAPLEAQTDGLSVDELIELARQANVGERSLGPEEQLAIVRSLMKKQPDLVKGGIQYLQQAV